MENWTFFSLFRHFMTLSAMRMTGMKAMGLRCYYEAHLAVSPAKKVIRGRKSQVMSLKKNSFYKLRSLAKRWTALKIL
jgi:hypothetical protein